MSGSKSAKKSANAQEKIANQNRLMFNQANQYYPGVLEMLARNAGIQLPVQTPQGAPAVSQGPSKGFGTANRFQAAAQGVPSTQPVGRPVYANAAGAPMMGAAMPTGTGALGDNQLGVFGQGEDRLRLMGAEEDINRQRDKNVNALTARLMRQGLGNSATMGSGLTKLFSEGDQQLAGFRRQLAINAGEEQRRRLGELLGALSPGMGAGNAASNIFGQQSAMANQGVQNAMGGLGNLLQTWQLQQMLKQGGGQGNIFQENLPGGGFYRTVG